MSASCWALWCLRVKAFESAALAAAAVTFPARMDRARSGKGGRDRAVPAPFLPAGCQTISPCPVGTLSPHPSGPQGMHKCFGKSGEGSGLSAARYSRCFPQSRLCLALLFLVASHRFSSECGEKNTSQGRRIEVPFLGLRDPMSPINATCQMAPGTAAGGDPRSPWPTLLSLVLPVYSGGPAWRGREMRLLCGAFRLKIVSLSCSI